MLKQVNERHFLKFLNPAPLGESFENTQDISCFLQNPVSRMSQEDSKWLVNWLFHLLMNGVNIGVITY